MFEAVPSTVVIDAFAMILVCPMASSTCNSFRLCGSIHCHGESWVNMRPYMLYSIGITKGSIKKATRNKRRVCVRHHLLSLATPFPTHRVTLNSSHNKAQLIQLLVASLMKIEVDAKHWRIVTGPEPAPIEVWKENWCCDVTHEEADVS